MKSKPFTPDWVSPTGDTIISCCEERQIPIPTFIQTLSSMCLISENSVCSILDGSSEINQDIAKALTILLGATESFWMNRDNNYWGEKKRLGI